MASRFGVMLGYSNRSVGISPEPAGTAGDFVDALTGDGRIRFERMHLVRVGLAF